MIGSVYEKGSFLLQNFAHVQATKGDLSTHFEGEKPASGRNVSMSNQKLESFDEVEGQLFRNIIVVHLEPVIRPRQ